MRLIFLAILGVLAIASLVTAAEVTENSQLGTNAASLEKNYVDAIPLEESSLEVQTINDEDTVDKMEEDLAMIEGDVYETTQRGRGGHYGGRGGYYGGRGGFYGGRGGYYGGRGGYYGGRGYGGGYYGGYRGGYYGRRGGYYGGRGYHGGYYGGRYY